MLLVAEFVVRTQQQPIHAPTHTHRATIQGFHEDAHPLTAKVLLRRMPQHKTSKWTANAAALTQSGVWLLKGVCHAPHSHTSSNEEPDVSPLSSDHWFAGACERIFYKVSHSVGLLKKQILVSALGFVPCTPPKHHLFRPRGRLWRPLVFTSIHLS